MAVQLYKLKTSTGRRTEPVYWRVEGSLFEMSAVRSVGFFNWNSQSFLERSVPARQLRGDRATVLRLARHRRPVQQDRGGVVAAVARASPYRRVKDDEMVAHYAPMSDRSPSVIPIGQLAERVLVGLPQLSILRTNTALTVSDQALARQRRGETESTKQPVPSQR